MNPCDNFINIIIKASEIHNFDPNPYINEYYINLNNNVKELCVCETDLTKKCILCKKYLKPQEWAPLLEKYVKEYFDINEPYDNVSGDGVKNGKNIEIKISLGSKNGKINFVQIRPDHNIDYYLMFSLVNDILHVMLIPSQDLYELLPEYGGYSHGTITEHGRITSNNIKGFNREFSLRPQPNGELHNKMYFLWQKMMQYEIFTNNLSKLVK